MISRRTGMGAGAFALVFGFVVWLACLSGPSANAIPAFSRKYQTSCATCHVNFPELNDFGEAFKKAGFRFPKDDDLFVKEPPVLLGAKAQKDAFPNAIYPGEIPGTIPIAFRYSGFFNYNSKQPAAISQANQAFQPRTDLFAPNTFTIIAAGSMGPTFSFWIDDDISTGGSGAEGGLGDGYIKVNDLGHYLHLPKDSLNVRFGQFELDLPFTQARTINLSDYDVYDEVNIVCPPGGDLTCEAGTTNNPFQLGTPQRGIEFGGYPNDGNFSWSVAVVNGSNDTPAMRNSKDVFVRVSQKFNLERDSSVRKEIQAAGPTGPRDHTSIRVGAFYYYGTNVQNQNGIFDLTLPELREPFYRVGGDLRFRYRNFELYGLGMYGRDQNHFWTDSTPAFVSAPPVTFTGGFGQAEYRIYPWLMGIMRYDWVNSPTDQVNNFSRFNTRSRYSPGFQVLVRANLKVAFEYQRRWEQDNGTAGFYRPNGFVSGIDYVF